MKKAFFILLLLPALAFSQDIPKFSTTIYAKGVSFQQAKAALLDSSYFIDQQKEQDGTIVTKEKGADNYRMFGSNLNRWTIIMRIRIKDSTATIMGQYSYMEGNQKMWKNIEYWKAAGSVPHHLFMIMDNFAHSVSSHISYSK